MGRIIDTVAQEILKGTDNGSLRRALGIHPGAIQTVTVIEFVEKILSTVLLSPIKRGNIDLLRVFGHGADGEQNVGGGFDHVAVEAGTKKPDIAPDADCCIYMVNGALNKRGYLQTLRGIFSPDGAVQLHGCYAGRGSEGRTLCLELARLWNVPVSAAYGLQFPDRADSYEGMFITATPQGHVYEKGATDLKCVRPGQLAPFEKSPGGAVAPLAVHRIGAVVGNQDCLSNIAKKWYGDMLLWPILFDFNKSPAYANQNQLKPWQSIVVPKIDGLKPEQRADYRRRGLNWR